MLYVIIFWWRDMKPLWNLLCQRIWTLRYFFLWISSIMLRSHRVYEGFFWPVVEVVSAVFSRARLIASGAPVITAGCCHFFFLYTAGTFKRMCCYFHFVSRSLWRSANSAVAFISIGLTSWLSSICCSGPRASQIPHQNTAGCQLKTDHSRRGASFLLVWDELSPSGRVNSS